jgi:hypothetical protein
MPVHRLDRDRQTGRRPGDTPRTSGGGQHRVAVTPRPRAQPARRVPGHTPWAGDRQDRAVPAFRAPARNTVEPRPDRPRSLKRVGIDRQSRRSLVLGGALVVAILGGAGAIAWAARPEAPQPSFSTDAGISTGSDETSTSPTNSQPAGTTSADPAGRASNAAEPATDDGSAAAASVVDHGPATVSQLAPGDPGFGWPSTAFGSVRIGSGT